ncbi:hypothetical protein CMI37_08570 [Candidatus Pacearchaeota archaeon]|nr:hypothetical protein [Candidatus Pacearchaeota archaeon]|tara:strand:- start:25 stop:426 length:402 start_codon:yes stop_codon:yes gene_type:complete
MTETHLQHNHYQWILNFSTNIVDYKANKITLHKLAALLCMLGPGKEFNANNLLEYPTKQIDLEMNEIVHNLLKENNLLDILRGFFLYDCEVNKEDSLKIAEQGYDHDLTDFLIETPNPRYFTQWYTRSWQHGF